MWRLRKLKEMMGWININPFLSCWCLAVYWSSRMMHIQESWCPSKLSVVLFIGYVFITFQKRKYKYENSILMTTDYLHGIEDNAVHQLDKVRNEIIFNRWKRILPLIICLRCIIKQFFIAKYRFITVLFPGCKWNWSFVRVYLKRSWSD